MKPERLLLQPPQNGVLDQVLQDEMGKLWARLEKDRRSGAPGARIVGVTAPTPGDGSTTVAVALARFLAHTLELDTCLVEADFRRPVLGQALSRPGPGLFGLLAGTAEPEAAIQPVQGALSLLPAGKGANGAFYPPAGAFRALLERLRARHAALILDCPALGLGAEALGYLEQAEVVVLVARSGRTKLESLSRCVDRLRESGASLGAVVLNQTLTSLPRALRALF